MQTRCPRCPSDAIFERGFERIRRDLGVVVEFPEPVARHARALAERGPRVPAGGDAPRDARELPFVTIDPAGSRDLDQAYAAERLGSGYRVFYAIADVAGFVTHDDVVSETARERGVTLYFPDVRAALHPEVLSEGAASLLPGEDRQAILWSIDLDEAGHTGAVSVERALVRSREALSYVEAQARIDGGSADSSLALLRPIGERRQELERDRGAVSLKLPSQEVVHSDGGYDLVYDTSLPIEGWNAQISLMCGMVAAGLMLDGGVGILRTLPPTHQGEVERLRRVAKALELDWPADVAYQDQLRSITGATAVEAAFLQQAVTVFRGAGYETLEGEVDTPPIHGAIAAPYAHVTAPLRRIGDRYANEVVLSLAAGHEPPAWLHEELADLPSLLGDAKRRSGTAERATIDFVEAVVLSSHVGQVLPAEVVDVDHDDFRVQLRDPAVIARVDGSAELGAHVEVRVAGVEPDARRVELELLS
ncbi:MAG: RNB domain-containing ribonuclease [Gaiellaceae bacterium]